MNRKLIGKLFYVTFSYVPGSVSSSPGRTLKWHNTFLRAKMKTISELQIKNPPEPEEYSVRVVCFFSSPEFFQSEVVLLVSFMANSTRR